MLPRSGTLVSPLASHPAFCFASSVGTDGLAGGQVYLSSLCLRMSLVNLPKLSPSLGGQHVPPPLFFYI